jgi:hypothetical protein
MRIKKESKLRTEENFGPNVRQLDKLKEHDQFHKSRSSFGKNVSLFPVWEYLMEVLIPLDPKNIPTPKNRDFVEPEFIKPINLIKERVTNAPPTPSAAQFPRPLVFNAPRVSLRSWLNVFVIRGFHIGFGSCSGDRNHPNTTRR